MSSDPDDRGAYRLIITLSRVALVVPGILGRRRLEPGCYCYVGSARSGLQRRVARHRRVASRKTGPVHWHIDALLVHRYARLERVELIPGGDECAVARATARQAGVSVPISGFGATDCRHGCRAHLFQLSALMAG